MAEQPQGWRVVVIANVLPIVEPLVETVRGLGHDVVAWVLQRRPNAVGLPPPPWGEVGDRSAPQGVNLIWARAKEDLAPMLRGLEPDVVLCWGFSWKIPQEALDVARYGSVNQHPALLPRHRGPIPISWALREGDSVIGTTWHRMDAEFDTGPILAQGSFPVLDEETTMFETGPRWVAAALELLPGVLEKLAADEPGEPQGEEGASWGGMFEEDYATIDWSAQTAREIHNQVRAWNYAFGMGPVEGPFAELDGKRVKVKQTSLTDRADGSPPVQTANGTIWVLETEA